MYSKLYTSVKRGNSVSNYFLCDIGTRQGCNMSPSLFKIYLNDLHKEFNMDSCKPVKAGHTKIGCLMYADDVLILSQDAVGLQNSLNKLDAYCKKWRLKINIRKTKIMVFNSRKYLHIFKIGNKILENTNRAGYLGFIITPSGAFKATFKHLFDKANRALFSMRSSLRSLHVIPVGTYIKLFDTLIKPVLLYGAEVWGAYLFKMQNNSLPSMLQNVTTLIEKLHSKFCKHVLLVNRKASNYAVRWELGRYPLFINIVCSVLKYFVNIRNRCQHSMVNLALGINMQLKNSWYAFIEFILTKTGYTIDSLNNNIICQGKNSILSKLKNVSQSIYYRKLCDCTKLCLYSSVKPVFSLENYLLHIKDSTRRRAVTQLRLSCHKLPIEIGRYSGLNREDRLCIFCGHCIGDEKHCLMDCFHPKLTRIRNEFLEAIFAIYPVMKNFSRLCLFRYIMLFSDLCIMDRCAKYVREIFEIYEEEYLIIK